MFNIFCKEKERGGDRILFSRGNIILEGGVLKKEYHVYENYFTTLKL